MTDTILSPIQRYVHGLREKGIEVSTEVEAVLLLVSPDTLDRLIVDSTLQAEQHLANRVVRKTKTFSFVLQSDKVKLHFHKDKGLTKISAKAAPVQLHSATP